MIAHNLLVRLSINYLAHTYILTIWMCGGLVVRVSASRSPIPGSNLGLGPPTVCSEGWQITMYYCKNKVLKNTRPWWAVKKKNIYTLYSINADTICTLLFCVPR